LPARTGWRKLKADFDGIPELVQTVPDPLKETALEIILVFSPQAIPQSRA